MPIKCNLLFNTLEDNWLQYFTFFDKESRSVMVNVLDCDIVVSEFKPQLCYNIHFQTNILGEVMNPLIPHPSYKLNIPLLFFYRDGFDIELAMINMPLNKETKPFYFYGQEPAMIGRTGWGGALGCKDYVKFCPKSQIRLFFSEKLPILSLFMKVFVKVYLAVVSSVYGSGSA